MIVELLVYVALMLGVLGYLARDELLWRVIMLSATFCYLGYYMFVPIGPLWNPFIVNAILGSVNLCMLVIVISERTRLFLDHETAALIERFPLFRPGLFRRFLRSGTRSRPAAGFVLTREGQIPASLFYVVSGTLRLEKGAHVSRIGADHFIGEIAFFTGAPASATVIAEEGVELYAWDSADLRHRLNRSRKLELALLAHLNGDLMRKVSQSMPTVPVAPRDAHQSGA